MIVDRHAAETFEIEHLANWLEQVASGNLMATSGIVSGPTERLE